VLDRDRTFRLVSDELARLYARSPRELLGSKPEEAMHPSDAAARQTFEREVLATGLTAPAREEELVDHGGRSHAHLVARAPMRGEDGTILGLVSCAMSSPYAQERAAIAAEKIDRITGLPTRLGFLSAVEPRLAEARAHGRSFALHLVTLDNLRDVNERFGHAMGDRLLQAVGRRLLTTGDPQRRAARAVARLSADCFAVAQANVAQDEQARAFSERLSEALAEPFQLSGEDIRVATRLNLLSRPDPNLDASELIDALLSEPLRARAVSQGAHSMSEAPQEPEDLAAALRLALSYDELRMHYQPRFGLEEGRIVAAEAFARWERPRSGLVSASVLFQIAEEEGVLGELTRRLAEKVTEDVQLIRAAGLDMIVAVKATSGQLRDATALNALAQMLGDGASGLAVEASPQALRENSEAASRLAALGAGVTLDCAGAPSPDALASAPRRARSAKVPMDGRHATPDALKGWSAAVHAQGLKAVGANIERADQLALLREAAFDQAQGYLLQRPVDVAELIALARQSAY
jgi:diguanylate cyclase (GGDEF)-like protein